MKSFRKEKPTGSCNMNLGLADIEIKGTCSNGKTFTHNMRSVHATDRDLKRMYIGNSFYTDEEKSIENLCKCTSIKYTREYKKQVLQGVKSDPPIQYIEYS